MQFWFSSDWHFMHHNIIKYSNRPFLNVDEMENSILDTMFSKIKKQDHLYFLGDLAMNGPKIKEIYLKFIKYKIQFYFIRGNHDKIPQDVPNYNILTKKINNQHITMCHFPMLSWDRSHYNSWCLYGHHHSNIVSTFFKGKRMNVGVDQNNYNPVNFDEIYEYMKLQSNNWDYIDKRDNL